MRDYAKKSSLVDEAKRRVGMEAKRAPVKRLAMPEKLAAPKAKAAKTSLSWSRLPPRVKSIIVVVIIVLALAWIIYHIPFARIGHSISEKTHGLGKSVHQTTTAQVSAQKASPAAPAAVPQKSANTVAENPAQNLAAASGATTSNSAVANPNATKSAPAPATPPPAPPKPVFDFYTVLPARGSGNTAAETPSAPTTQTTTTANNPAPASNTSPSSAVTTTSPASSAQTPANAQSPSATQSPKPFMLQVGSFVSPNDADKLRAQFLLAGLNPTINQDANGRYRVMFGPFNAPKDADAVRAKISKANIAGVSIQTVAQ